MIPSILRTAAIAAFLVLGSLSGWGQGTESFANIPTASSTSYLNRSWTGDDGVTWTATAARTDQTLTGKAICTNGSGTVTSPTYSGGMGTLTFNYVRAFTGTSARSIQVWVNGSQVGSTITVDPNSNTVANYSANINTTGNVTLELKTSGAQIKIDDISWTTYSVSGFTISATAGANGSISPSGNVNVASGGNQSFTITPNSCYNVADVLVNGASVGAVSSYSFTNVTANQTISATFSIKGPYNIVATAGANGSISPAGTTSVTCGSSQTYTITPNSGYSVQDVLVDGVSVGAVTSYTFNNVTAAHTISVSFAVPTTPKMVISQVYGGGGNTSAPYKNDFIELFNAGTSTVNLNGWSVQYTSSSGTTWAVSNLPNTSIGAGKYFLIELASGGATGASLPTPDHTGTINLSGTAGKVALVNSTSALSGSCPSSSSIQDFVGFGSANCYEGTAASPAPSNTVWITRVDNGCTDTDENSADFSTTSSVTPRNTASTLNTCSPKFNITTSAGTGGSISPSGTVQVPSGNNQTFTIAATSCYNISDVLVDGVSQGAITSYTFTNVTTTHTISASFSIKGPYNIVASAGANGSISPSGTTAVTCGNNQTYTITANTGYAVSDVLVDGVSVGAVSSYTFNNVTAAHTISVSFVAVVYNLSTSTAIRAFLCPGAGVAVPYTINYPASSGNTFTVQLSNASGSFSSPVVIGSASATTSGTISATIPANTPAGTGYRIRVISSNPSLNGSDNGTDITIQFNQSVPVFTEGSGTVSANTTMNSHETANGFDNDGFTMTGTAEIRSNTNNSTGYQDASGNAHFYVSAGNFFRIDGISTTGLNPLSLNFGITKSTTGDNGSSLLVEVSTNSGSTWSTVNWGTLQTGSGTGDGNWQLVKTPGTIPAAATVSLRFTNNSGSVFYRIDDVNLYSGSAASASISPTSPPAQCAGTVVLTASPSGGGYSWTGGTSSSTLAATFSGSYSVTVTDRFGCQASAGPVNVTINTPVTASVSISPTLACAGTPVTFTATPVNGGTTPSYTWKVNGAAQGSGSTFNTTLSYGDAVTCEMQSSLSCFTPSTAVSNAVVAQKLSHTPTTAWTESFGTTGSTVIGSYVGYTNGQGLTFSGSPAGYPEIRTTQASPAGGSNMYFATSGTAGGNVVLTISGINTTTAFPNNLSFYLWNDGAALSGSNFPIEYSTDGVNYFPLTYGPTSSTQAWYQININNALPYGNNVRLRFTNGAGNQPRIDALKLEKYTSGDAAITPSGPTTFCSGGNVTLDATPDASGLTYEWSNSSTATSVVANTSGTYTITITDGFGCESTASQAVTVNICGTYTWLGNTTQWTAGGNWSTGVAPSTCSHDVLIPAVPAGGNFPTIGLVSPTIGNLEIENGARITANNVLKVCGNITGGNNPLNLPAIIGSSYVELNGTGGTQQISGQIQFTTIRLNNADGAQLSSGAAANIITALQLQHGTFTTTGGTLRFKSGAPDEYAILDNFSDNSWDGVLSGNAASERYVPVAGNNQHYLGTPIVGATFAQLGGSGTAGYLIPKPTCDQTQMANGSPYGNVFQWHDNDPDIIANNCLFYGWEVKKTGTTEAGRGYSVYLNQGIFSITGAINQGTSYTVGGCDNVGWANNTLQTAGMIPAAYESGWHIVANPFQAPIELSGHTPTFDDAAIWVTSGPYNGTYQPLSITGGTVAPFQGFIVHRNGASAADFVFSKDECVTTQGVNYYKTASQHQLSINVSGNNFADVTYVEYNSDATNAFDVNYDSRKPLSKLGQPTLFTFNTNPNSRLSRNINRTISETPNVPMSFIPGADGTFSITVDGINTFDPTTYIFLEDKKTGTWTDMRAHGSYSFQSLTADAYDRFVLHFTPAAIINTTAATCETNGTLYLEQPGTASWNYAITNSQSAIINAGTLNNSNSTVLGVPAGTYTITLTDNSGYTVVKAVTVSGNSATAAIISSSAQTVEEGQTIYFTNNTTTIAAEWDMGDGTVFTNLNDINYQYTEPGVYTVTLTVTNADGCVSGTTQLITVTEAAVTGIVNIANNGVNIFSFSNTVVVDFGKAKNVDATVDIYNLLGQKLTSDKTTNNIYAKNIADLGAAYVVVRVNNNGVESRKKVFLSGE